MLIKDIIKCIRGSVRDPTLDKLEVLERKLKSVSDEVEELTRLVNDLARKVEMGSVYSNLYSYLDYAVIFATRLLREFAESRGLSWLVEVVAYESIVPYSQDILHCSKNEDENEDECVIPVVAIYDKQPQYVDLWVNHTRALRVAGAEKWVPLLRRSTEHIFKIMITRGFKKAVIDPPPKEVGIVKIEREMKTIVSSFTLNSILKEK